MVGIESGSETQMSKNIVVKHIWFWGIEPSPKSGNAIPQISKITYFAFCFLNLKQPQIKSWGISLTDTYAESFKIQCL